MKKIFSLIYFAVTLPAYMIGMLLAFVAVPVITGFQDAYYMINDMQDEFEK
jgi:hypothetical protein